GSRGSAGAAASCGSIRRTARRFVPGSPGTGAWSATRARCIRVSPSTSRLCSTRPCSASTAPRTRGSHSRPWSRCAARSRRAALPLGARRFACIPRRGTRSTPTTGRATRRNPPRTPSRGCSRSSARTAWAERRAKSASGAGTHGRFTANGAWARGRTHGVGWGLRERVARTARDGCCPKPRTDGAGARGRSGLRAGDARRADDHVVEPDVAVVVVAHVSDAEALERQRLVPGSIDELFTVDPDFDGSVSTIVVGLDTVPGIRGDLALRHRREERIVRVQQHLLELLGELDQRLAVHVRGEVAARGAEDGVVTVVAERRAEAHVEAYPEVVSGNGHRE